MSERNTVTGSIVHLEPEGDEAFWMRFFACSASELRAAVETAGPELWTIQGFIWRQRELKVERREG